MSIRLIVGLGNPGPEYELTRHNAGFWLVDNLANSLPHCSLKRDAKMNALMAKATIGDQETWLLEPQTFMNRSGQSVGALARFYKIVPDEILVVHDELEKPFGYVGTKFDGSAKGHNGLRSIIERIGTGFWRLRVGIGRPDRKEEVGNYVLESFSREEEVDCAAQARYQSARVRGSPLAPLIGLTNSVWYRW